MFTIAISNFHLLDHRNNHLRWNITGGFGTWGHNHLRGPLIMPVFLLVLARATHCETEKERLQMNGPSHVQGSLNLIALHQKIGICNLKVNFVSRCIYIHFLLQTRQQPRGQVNIRPACTWP